MTETTPKAAQKTVQKKGSVDGAAKTGTRKKETAVASDKTVVKTKSLAGTAKKTATAKTSTPAKAPSPRKTPGKKTSRPAAISDEQRYRMIAEAAYYRAESRQFKSDPLRDWIEAEKDIASLLSEGS